MSFTLALLCDPGCEAVAVVEVEELLGKKARPGRGYVVVEACSVEEIGLFCYRSQSASRILAFIAEGVIAEPEDILKERGTLLGFDYAPFREEGGSFRATCERHGEQPFQAQEVEAELGALLHTEKSFPVNLKAPSMELWCKVTDESYVIGVDLVGRDLAKRDYKAFHTRKSLRGSVAYAAVRLSGFSGEEVLLDPFTMDGAIPIEAALFSTEMPLQRFKKEFAFTAMPFAQGHDWDDVFARRDEQAGQESQVSGFADQVRTLKMARGNAKLAGIDKAVHLTKVDVDWIDTKFGPSSVDLIVTQPPSSGKNTPLKEVERPQEDLFQRAKSILAAKGRVLIVSEKKAEFLNAAAHHGFSLEKEHEIWQGGTKLLFLRFKKGK